MNVFTTLKLTTSLVLAAGLTTQAHAYSGCTVNSLYGIYGVQFSGAVASDASTGVGGAIRSDKVKVAIGSDAPATANPAAGFARLYMDGGGNLFGNAGLTLNGAWSESPLTGTYTVNDDCTVSMTLTDSSGGAQHFDGVVVSHGNGAFLRQTDKGVAVSASMNWTRNTCQPSDIGGNFAFRTSGTKLDSGPFSSIGSLFLDPDGNATASESRFSGWASSQVASKGTITVSSDCTVTLSLASTTDGALTTYRGILVNNLKEVLLVRADDGTSITGNMVVQ